MAPAKSVKRVGVSVAAAAGIAVLAYFFVRFDDAPNAKLGAPTRNANAQGVSEVPSRGGADDALSLDLSERKGTAWKSR